MKNSQQAELRHLEREAYKQIESELTEMPDLKDMVLWAEILRAQESEGEVYARIYSIAPNIKDITKDLKDIVPEFRKILNILLPQGISGNISGIWEVKEEMILEILAALREKIKNREVDTFPSFLFHELEWRGLRNPKARLTILDFLSTGWLEDNKLRKLVDDILHRLTGKWKVWEKDATKIINDIYNRAIDQVRYSGLPVPTSVEQHADWEARFASYVDFIDYLKWIRNANKSRKLALRVMDCVIVRTMDSIADIDMQNRISELDNEAKAVLDKLNKFDNIIITPIGDEGKYQIIHYGEKPFSGVFRMRKKHLRNILLKLQYNRKYDNAELMNDLLGLRFESTNSEDIENAVCFFAHHLFNPVTVELDQKGGLLSNDFLVSCSDIEINSGAYNLGANKESTSHLLQNADIVGTISFDSKNKKNKTKCTGNVEMQFQKVDGMNNLNSSEIYDMKKFISCAARNLWGISIAQLKFYIRLVGLNSGIPEKKIIEHLYYPCEDWRPPFLVFMKSQSTGQMRISTTDVWTKDYERLYEDYPARYEHISGVPKGEPDSHFDMFNKKYEAATNTVRPMLEWAKREWESLKAV